MRTRAVLSLVLVALATTAGAQEHTLDFIWDLGGALPPGARLDHRRSAGRLDRRLVRRLGRRAEGRWRLVVTGRRPSSLDQPAWNPVLFRRRRRDLARGRLIPQPADRVLGNRHGCRSRRWPRTGQSWPPCGTPGPWRFRQTAYHPRRERQSAGRLEDQQRTAKAVPSGTVRAPLRRIGTIADPRASRDRAFFKEPPTEDRSDSQVMPMRRPPAERRIDHLPGRVPASFRDDGRAVMLHVLVLALAATVEDHGPTREPPGLEQTHRRLHGCTHDALHGRRRGVSGAVRWFRR